LGENQERGFIFSQALENARKEKATLDYDIGVRENWAQELIGWKSKNTKG